MSKYHYHVARLEDGWEVLDATDTAINPEPFRNRGEALRFLRNVKEEQARADANDRYWSRLESYQEDRYDIGD